MTSVFSYVSSWLDVQLMPLGQGLFQSTIFLGKFISSVTFSLIMKTPERRTIFYLCMAVVSVAATIGFNCTPVVSQHAVVIPKAQPKQPAEQPLATSDGEGGQQEQPVRPVRFLCATMRADHREEDRGHYEAHSHPQDAAVPSLRRLPLRISPGAQWYALVPQGNQAGRAAAHAAGDNVEAE